MTGPAAHPVRLKMLSPPTVNATLKEQRLPCELYAHLHPEGSVEDALSQCVIGRHQLGHAVLEMGEGAVAWALEEAARSLERLQGEFQTVADLPTPEIRLNLETMIIDIFMAAVSRTNERLAVNLIPSMARQAARREVPFSNIVKNMRANQIKWVNSFFAASSNQLMTSATVQRLVTCGAGVVDELIERFVLSYLDERQTLMEGQIARRRAMVEKLIDSELAPDPLDLKQIKDDHGLDLQHYHVGLVISDFNSTTSTDSGKLQRNLQDAIDGSTALVVSSTQHITWAWLSIPERPSPTQIKRLEETLRHLGTVRCALGEPAKGWVGFRRTHLQARDVSSVATAFATPGLLRWGDHVLTILVGQDLEKAAWFVESVLGPLAENSPKASGYRQTLSAYLHSGHSLLHGAQALGIHRNTLVYRLEQIEILLECAIKQRELEIRCALHLVSHFEGRVLKTEGDAAVGTA